MASQDLRYIPARMSEGYLTIREVAVLFRVTRRTILNWQQQGLIPYYKIGRTVRFDPVEIERHLQAHCRAGKPAIPLATPEP